ncbi:proton-coupled amino acid transporter-like protein pathetic [Galleria mellonella]|uniref:Proton-coupled amino acid transporter-like protein pathetic n=1 Tax=Galleria mellonella TaxID=7137 RepID=A0A6J3BSA6_GALME|nr:proton-coupled amino acid transporter-like protein pathetic [Galleria mellonella]
MAGLKPAEGGSGNFRALAQNQQEEDAFDYAQFRDVPKPSGVIGSVAHMIKGALGGGILGGHVAYMKAGIAIAIPFNIICGFYMTYCLYILVHSAQILYRRTRIPSMSYPDVGEAAVACFSNPKVAKYSKVFRYTIDGIICLDLFGSCACYQLIIAKSIKQLVENTQETSLEGLSGYPSLRVYLAAIIVPIILICLVTHLKWLAPVSAAANVVILFAIGMAVHYALHFNPSFSNLVPVTTVWSFFEFIGMSVFTMSCAGIVIPIENNMKEPKKFTFALIIGMIFIVSCTFLVSFFGYVAFLEKSDAPLTVNFPMTTWPMILKGAIALMIYVTHAINFWVPFNLCFHYIKPKHNQLKIIQWELFYRILFVILISVVAIIFPNINALMGFLGAFCLSNMAFIWPNLINLLVIWDRPGLGKYKWRLWRALILIFIGIFILICGSIVNMSELMLVFV